MSTDSPSTENNSQWMCKSGFILKIIQRYYFLMFPSCPFSRFIIINVKSILSKKSQAQDFISQDDLILRPWVSQSTCIFLVPSVCSAFVRVLSVNELLCISQTHWLMGHGVMWDFTPGSNMTVSHLFFYKPKPYLAVTRMKRNSVTLLPFLYCLHT